MLFQVEMDVHFPPGFDPAEATRLKAEEKARFQLLQRSGKWRHIWRIVGHYKNLSIFDVESNEELHDLLISLPLFPLMAMKVTPLCRHPSSVHEDDR